MPFFKWKPDKKIRDCFAKSRTKWKKVRDWENEKGREREEDKVTNKKEEEVEIIVKKKKKKKKLNEVVEEVQIIEEEKEEEIKIEKKIKKKNKEDSFKGSNINQLYGYSPYNITCN